MSQIAQAMGNIDQVTQQNAATSEEAAAAAEELNAQAVAMQDMVSEIGDMVGFINEQQHTGARQAPSRSRSNAPKAMKQMSLGTPKRTSSPRKSSSNNDVFPLDDEDLKEF
jgi:ABC-type transporter Mla subunit MlaD